MNDFLLKKAAYYYYNKLSIREKNWYMVFLNNILSMKREVEIKSELCKEQIRSITSALVDDRPDIFWYRGSNKITTRNNTVVRITFEFVYSEAQVKSIISKIESCSLYNEINRYMLSAKSDFEKALCLYECIIKNVEYESAVLSSADIKYEYAYGIEGVLLNKRAVCAGYAQAFQYFSNKHNIVCTVVSGLAGGELHAWNLINLDGEYYYIDTTWGDPIFFHNSEKADDYISYDYFCITTEELKRSHHPVFDTEMPLCRDTKYNYYSYYGLVDDCYSVESIAKHIINAKKQGKKAAVIKYSSKDAYDKAVTRLFSKSEVFRALRIAKRSCSIGRYKRIRYGTNEDLFTIRINFC